MRRGTKWLLGVVGGFFGLLAVLVVAVVLLFQWDWLRQPLAGLLSGATGRSVTIGHLVGQWSLRPRIVLDDFRVANAPWAKPSEMVSVQHAEIVINVPDLLRGRVDIPAIKLVHPLVTLERRGDGTTNWTFGARQVAKTATPQKRSEVPLVGRIDIEGGRLIYHDEKLGLNVDSRISTVVGTGHQGAGGVQLRGTGTMHGEAFQLVALGGSLINLSSTRKPWPLTLDLTVGPTHGRLSGTLTEPVKFKGLNVNVGLSGPDLSRLTNFTGVPLPITPPYQLSGHLQRQGAVWRITGMAGRVGHSDLEGDIGIDTGHPRLDIQANLHSRVLDYRDVGSLVGLRATAAAPPPAAAPRRILPNAPLATKQIRQVDARVRFHGDKVNAPRAPLNQVDLDLVLKDGVLHLAPLDVGVAGGLVRAGIVVDAHTDNVTTRYDLRLSRFQLARFLDSAGLKGDGSGEIYGRILLTGYGDTVRKSLGSSNGAIRVVVNHGSVLNLGVALAGLDIARTLGILATGQKPIPLRCFVADFQVKNGVARPKTFVLDTREATVTMNGSISLRHETMALQVQSHPKGPTLSAHTPIDINGPFTRPSIAVAKAPLVARGAGAVVLGTLLTPLASVLAFIDPGLPKSPDCAALENHPGG